MTANRNGLASRIARELHDIRVDAARHIAVVGDREISAQGRAELETRLAADLYAVLHAGLRGLDTGEDFLNRDRWLEDALAESAPHRGTPITAVLCETSEEDLVVEWDGVRVRLPRNTAVAAMLPLPGNAIRLHVPPVRPGLSPGFLWVAGSRLPEPVSSLLRVYVHLTEPRAAVGAWRTILRELEDAAVPYQAKVLSRAGQYPRRDAVVVYLPQSSADAAALVADAVRTEPSLGEDTSVFTERLAPGVATAWEPVDTRFGFSGLSFGQHRCRVLAHALLESAVSGRPRELEVVSAFLEAGIDPGKPAFNYGRRS